MHLAGIQEHTETRIVFAKTVQFAQSFQVGTAVGGALIFLDLSIMTLLQLLDQRVCAALTAAGASQAQALINRLHVLNLAITKPMG